MPTLEELLAQGNTEFQKAKTYADSLRDRRMAVASQISSQQTPDFINAGSQLGTDKSQGLLENFLQSGQNYLQPVGEAQTRADNLFKLLLSATPAESTKEPTYSERLAALKEGYDIKDGEFVPVGDKAKTNENKVKALDLVDSLLKGNYQAVSGTYKTPGFLASIVPGAAAARADFEGLGQLLALAKRGELKGSGTVSDFEAKMLQKAALAGLSTELPEKEFKKRLEGLRKDLAGGESGQTTQESQIDVKSEVDKYWK